MEKTKWNAVKGRRIKKEAWRRGEGRETKPRRRLKEESAGMAIERKGRRGETGKAKVK